jgi:hypothetical protein
LPDSKGVAGLRRRVKRVWNASMLCWLYPPLLQFLTHRHSIGCAGVAGLKRRVKRTPEASLSDSKGGDASRAEPYTRRIIAAGWASVYFTSLCSTLPDSKGVAGLGRRVKRAPQASLSDSKGGDASGTPEAAACVRRLLCPSVYNLPLLLHRKGVCGWSFMF